MNERVRSNSIRLTLGVALFVVVALAALVGARPITARRSTAATVTSAAVELASLRAWATGPTEPVVAKAEAPAARRADVLAPPLLGPALPVVEAACLVLPTPPTATVPRAAPEHPASRVLARRHRSRAPPAC